MWKSGYTIGASMLSIKILIFKVILILFQKGTFVIYELEKYSITWLTYCWGYVVDSRLFVLMFEIVCSYHSLYNFLGF